MNSTPFTATTRWGREAHRLLPFLAILGVILSGCGSGSATASQTQGSTPGASATPTSIAAPPVGTRASLTTVDWANTTYPDVCQIGAGGNVTVVNGIATGTNGISMRINDPLFGFITRTNQVDAIITYECTGANSAGRRILVFAGDATLPHLIGQLPLVSAHFPLASVFTEGIGAHQLELSGVGYSSTSIPHCCPDVWITDTYQWNGTAFVLNGHQATALGSRLTT